MILRNPLQRAMLSSLCIATFMPVTFAVTCNNSRPSLYMLSYPPFLVFYVSTILITCAVTYIKRDLERLEVVALTSGEYSDETFQRLSSLEARLAQKHANRHYLDHDEKAELLSVLNTLEDRIEFLIEMSTGVERSRPSEIAEDENGD
jgi:hypothetical protein